MTIKLITSNQRKQYKRLIEDLGDRGLKEVNPNKEGLQRLLEKGGEFQTYVCAGIRRFTAKAPNYELAKNILGKDFISPEDIAKARGITYTDEQLAIFGDTLPAQEVLEWCRDNGMMLVAGPPEPMSTLDIRALKKDYFYSKEGGWYSNKSEKFARDDKVEPVWIALRKEPVADSFNKNWSEQSNLVVEPMIVPNAAKLLWGITTCRAVRDVCLFPNLYVRTSSVDSVSYLVYLGFFVSDGLYVYYYWDDYRDGFLGLSAARKSK